MVARVKAGDAFVVLVGKAHRLLEDLDGSFNMVGSYPKRQFWDICYGKEGEEGQNKDTTEVDWFERDPVHDDEGPALEA